MNNQNISLNQNIALIENIITSSLNIVCDDILTHIHEEIDVDKFKSWFNYNLDKFKDKSNVKVYFQKAFTNELNKGTFKTPEIKYLPSIEPLLNELRNKGIILLANDVAYLKVLFQELLNTYEIPAKEIVKINHKLVDRCKDYIDYKEQIKAELSSYKIDWGDIEHKTQVYIAMWDFTLNVGESMA